MPRDHADPPPLGRPFWLVWTASTVSTLGDGIRGVALPLLAAALSRDPRAVALVSAAGFLPWPLFGLLGGAVVDRVDRRRLMWRVDLLRAVLVAVFALLVVRSAASIALLASVSFALGLAETFFDNAASAIMPMLVPPARIERANSWLLSSQTIMTTLVGAPIGGALFAIAEVTPIAVDSASFAVAAGLVDAVVGRFVPRSESVQTSIRTEIVDGLRWLWQHRTLRVLCLLLAVMNASFAAADAVLVLYTLEVLHVGTFGYGVLLAMIAIGGVLGTVLAPLVSRLVGLRGVVAVGALGQAAALLVAGLSSRLALAVLALVLVGITSMIWNVVTISLRQRVVPAALLGRVTSSYRVVGLGAMPVGALAGGALARGFGLHTPYLVGGVVLAAATVAALPFVRAESTGV